MVCVFQKKTNGAGRSRVRIPDLAEITCENLPYKAGGPGFEPAKTWSECTCFTTELRRQLLYSGLSVHTDVGSNPGPAFVFGAS